MDLSVAVGSALGLWHSNKRVRIHRNHRLLSLAGINVIQQMMATRCLPTEEILPRLTRCDRGQQLDAVGGLRDIEQSRRKLQGPHKTPGLRGKPELLDRRLPDNRNLSLNETGTLRLSEPFHTFECRGRRKHPDPLAI